MRAACSQAADEGTKESPQERGLPCVKCHAVLDVVQSPEVAAAVVEVVNEEVVQSPEEAAIAAAAAVEVINEGSSSNVCAVSTR